MLPQGVSSKDVVDMPVDGQVIDEGAVPAGKIDETLPPDEVLLPGRATGKSKSSCEAEKEEEKISDNDLIAWVKAERKKARVGPYGKG